MRCSGCGMEIPFIGQVCPHCQRDKSGDQQAQALAVFYAFIGATIGWFVSGFLAAIIGTIVGVIVAVIVAAKAGAGKTQAPEVRVVDNSDQESSTIASRLASLEHLKSNNLISEIEFNEKRQEILKKL